jgi:DegV family protein with EDD domain
MSIGIVVDSASDIPSQFIKDLGLTEVAINITFGDKLYKENVNINGDEFYKMLDESDILPTTSQPSPGDFEKVYTSLLKKHSEILSIHISTKVSGTYNSAVQAAEKVGKGKVTVIDSKTVSMGTGLVAISVAQKLKSNKSIKMSELAKLTNELSSKSKILVACETIENLKRGGRISAGAAFFGGLLSVKPVIGNKNGEVVSISRPRSMMKALAFLRGEAERHSNHQGMAVMQTTESFDSRGLYNSLSGNADLVKSSKDKKTSSDNMYVGEVIKAQFGPAIGTHAGPGAVGIAFIGDLAD